MYTIKHESRLGISVVNVQIVNFTELNKTDN